MYNSLKVCASTARRHCGAGVGGGGDGGAAVVGNKSEILIY